MGKNSYANVKIAKTTLASNLRCLLSIYNQAVTVSSGYALSVRRKTIGIVVLNAVKNDVFALIKSICS